ncbi:MAG: TldD/PmbA family protein [Candidatus Hodarchaeales archaeon]|jgi:PmbA protein
MEINTDQLIEMATFAIQQVKGTGMEGASVNANIKKVFSTRFANSAIHQNFVDLETDFMITVIKGQKKTDVTINSLERQDITWAVEKASKMVTVFPDDPEFPGILPEQKYPKLQLNDPTAKDLSSADIADKIVSGINAGHDFSPKVKTVSGNLTLKDGFSYFLSSVGLEDLTPVTSIISSINIMTDDGHGESRSNSSFGERRFSNLPFEKEAVKVAQRSVLGLNAQEIDPNKAYPVILDFQAVANQMFFISEAMSGRMVIDKRSFLRDKVGEQVFSDSLTLINDPHDSTSLAARPFDAEGVATKKYTLINKGVIENFAHDRKTARKMGTKSNGCAMIIWGESSSIPIAAKIISGQKSRQQLIEEMDNGLLVTNLHYTNFIDVSRGTETGMTKDGLFIIKNGEIVGSAHNMRFTDSLPQMFSNTEISREILQVVTFGMSRAAPTIKLDSMNFSSKTTH